MPSRKIENLLNAEDQKYSPLQKLLNRAEQQQAATAEVRALLPEALRSGCRVVDPGPPRLVLACRTAAAATRLRFQAPELLEQLKALPQYANVDEINVRVVEN